MAATMSSSQGCHLPIGAGLIQLSFLETGMHAAERCFPPQYCTVQYAREVTVCQEYHCTAVGPGSAPFSGTSQSHWVAGSGEADTLSE